MELPDFDLTEELQQEALQEYKNAALLDINEGMLHEADKLLSKIKEYYNESEEALMIIDKQIKKLHGDREKRYINYYE